jgi:UDP-N-acetylglucosamine/UDP-N-acetyl-alpha-D-glucosaminouronate 4-epimerase
MIVVRWSPQGRRRKQNSAYGPLRRAFFRSQLMAQYLVTGGAGFIGSHLAEELVRRGHRVRVADSLVTGKRANLAHLPSVEFVQGDLSDIEVARRVVDGCEFVLHQAALPSVPRSVKDPIGSNRANVDATLNILVASRDARVTRVIFAGSSSVYGNAPALPKHEGMPNSPLSPYALQKVVGEQYLQMFTALYGLETVTIRYFNVFGPRQDPSSPYSGVISLFASALLNGRAPTIHGDGEQTRDFTYVANVVDGVLRACEAPRAKGQIINVATGDRISLNRLFETMRKLIGVDVKPVYAPSRAGDVRDSQADIHRAKELLGYEPFVSFEEGLRKTVDWYRGQPTDDTVSSAR